MCRLFGIHALNETYPHYLIHSEYPFVNLSDYHKDGWGLACYNGQKVQMTRSLKQAMHDPDFFELISQLQTRTLIAHLRLATIGQHRVTNNHPFQYQDWTFAHNGNIKNFARYRDYILSQICPHFQVEIQGDTDSELIFYFLLTELNKWGLLSGKAHITTQQIGQTIKWALDKLMSLIGPHLDQAGDPTETYLSFLLTNGQVMLAHQGGQPLYYTTSPHYQKSDSISQDHIVFCSEPIEHPDAWNKMKAGELIAVDEQLHLQRFQMF